MPTPKQIEKLANSPLRTPGSTIPLRTKELPAEYWDAVLRDPRAAGGPWLPVSQMRLSEIPRELLRVGCNRCLRCVEIQRLDAVKLLGPHAIWKDVGQRLLDGGCKIRTGRHEKDGCWLDFKQ
jgi:hypothetical protein